VGQISDLKQALKILARANKDEKRKVLAPPQLDHFWPRHARRRVLTSAPSSTLFFPLQKRKHKKEKKDKKDKRDSKRHKKEKKDKKDKKDRHHKDRRSRHSDYSD
jgi:ABC-type Zn2+ transport system substrate-binding protein/surface adhesin